MQRLENKTIVLVGKKFLGVKVKLEKAAIMLLVSENNPSTFIACGYIDVNRADKWGDTVGIVTGVREFEDMLEGKIVSVSKEADRRGAKEGITGKEFLEKFG